MYTSPIMVLRINGPHSTVSNMSNWRQCLTADPGVSSSIQAWFHTFAETGHEIITKAIFLPFADSRRTVVSYMRKFVHKVLVNRLVKLAQEKSVVN